MKAWQWMILGVGALIVGGYGYSLYSRKSNLFVPPGTTDADPNAAADQPGADDPTLAWIKSKKWFSDKRTGVFDFTKEMDVSKVTRSVIDPTKFALPPNEFYIGELVDQNTIRWTGRVNTTVLPVYWKTI